MKEQIEEHLGEEQILWAVIDSQELAADIRNHLDSCRLCMDKVKDLKTDLKEFGEKARQAVPPLSRPVKVPAARPVKTGEKVGGWLPIFGAAAMAGLVVFFYVMGLNTVTPLRKSASLDQEMVLEDETLMREITDLVEYPLPDDVYEIIGINGADYDDDFMDFAVPEMLDDVQS